MEALGMIYMATSTRSSDISMPHSKIRTAAFYCTHYAGKSPPNYDANGKGESMVVTRNAFPLWFVMPYLSCILLNSVGVTPLSRLKAVVK